MINPKRQFCKELTEFPCKHYLVEKLRKSKTLDDKKSSDFQSSVASTQDHRLKPKNDTLALRNKI